MCVAKDSHTQREYPAPPGQHPAVSSNPTTYCNSWLPAHHTLKSSSHRDASKSSDSLNPAIIDPANINNVHTRKTGRCPNSTLMTDQVTVANARASTSAEPSARAIAPSERLNSMVISTRLAETRGPRAPQSTAVGVDGASC